LRNAYLEIDGSLSAKISAAFSGQELTDVAEVYQVTAHHDAVRATEARADAAARGEAAPAVGTTEANASYSAPAEALFTAMCALNGSSDEASLAAARAKREAYVALPAVTATPAAGLSAASAIEPPITTARGFYRSLYGVDPDRHAVELARTMVRASRRDAAAVASALGVAATGLDALADVPSEVPIIDESNRRLVRPDFTVEIATHNAAEMWRLLHGFGELHLIEAVLYGPYNDEEQRLIRVAFRRLSGGLDLQFFLQQAIHNRQAVDTYGALNFASLGAEGTSEGQAVTGGRVSDRCKG
jgi:hypothetical protein